MSVRCAEACAAVAPPARVRTCANPRSIRSICRTTAVPYAGADARGSKRRAMTAGDPVRAMADGLPATRSVTDGSAESSPVASGNSLADCSTESSMASRNTNSSAVADCYADSSKSPRTKWCKNKSQDDHAWKGSTRDR